MTTQVPQLFGSHQNAYTGANEIAQMNDRTIIDVTGSAALPYLQTLISSDVRHLTVPGMGLRCTAKVNEIALELYYFTELAFRIFVDNDIAPALVAALSEGEESHDIDVITRNDLRILALRGDNAFKTVLSEFALTPGIILTGEQQRYARQAGNVFLTATHLESHKGYELVAKSDELAKWQSRFIALGFSEQAELLV
ncbi:hypothetical protein [Pseudoalteromonas sp. MMG024]|uniref:hypothetical protein n=1 Tax=Pseudoalteromonas sp. MMG024 TaxID=2909980 RepID=UPI001F21031B|nr:hypothetical protein [Pseudoalteromonas sp. MMG024]MCF6459371.1 hypothetical protein [Pseudoalteromonas sp. MMG024]